MAITYKEVSATGGGGSVSTISCTCPALAANEMALFCIAADGYYSGFYNPGNPISPTEWSLVGNWLGQAPAYGNNGVRVRVYSRLGPVASHSVTFSMAGASSGYGKIIVVQSGGGVPRVAETQSSLTSSPTWNTIYNSGTPPAVTAVLNGELHIYLLGITLSASGTSTPVGGPTGATLWTGAPIDDYQMLIGSYQLRNAGQSNTGKILETDPEQLLGYQGTAAISLRIDQYVAPEVITESPNFWGDAGHQDSPSMAGGDPRWQYLAFLYRCNGEEGSASFNDSGPNQLDRTLAGAATNDAYIDTVVKKFGTASLRHTGLPNPGSPYASKGYVPEITLPEPIRGDFTYEFFVRPRTWGISTIGWNDYNYLFWIGNSNYWGTGYSYVYVATYDEWGMEIYGEEGSNWLSAYAEPNPLVDDVWQHIAIVRQADTWTVYLEGQPIMTDTQAGVNLGDRVFIANDPTLTDGGYNGNFDEIRLTRLARYNTAFTPPTAEFLGIPPDILAAAGRLINAFAFTDAASVESRYYRSVTTGPAISDTHAVQLLFKPAITENPRIRGLAIAGWPVTLADMLNVSPAVIIARAQRVIEALRLNRILSPTLTYQKALSESIRAVDLLARFASGAVVESLQTADISSYTTKYGSTLVDSAALTDAATHTLTVRVLTNEALNLSDTNVLKMFFKPTLMDRVVVSLAYVAPGDSVTTWTVNTRTGATTEYTNFNFNSFAEFGRSYLAASSTGLYELKGDDDAGTDIIAKMKSGFAQFYGSHLTHIKAAFIGMRGSGDFLFKIETTTGGTYVYAVTTESMKTHRIHIGKGIRARYFSFELESTGQDFDLENVKFVPLIAQRRI